jgi:hypothetical protein
MIDTAALGVTTLSTGQPASLTIVTDVSVPPADRIGGRRHGDGRRRPRTVSVLTIASAEL